MNGQQGLKGDVGPTGLTGHKGDKGKDGSSVSCCDNLGKTNVPFDINIRAIIQ
jgi:hypothetical protein